MPAVTATSGAYTGPTAQAKLTFTIPARTVAKTARKAAFISSAASNISVVARNTMSQSLTTPLALASYCASQSDNSQLCTIPITSPLGSVTFNITLFDSFSDALAEGVNATPIPITEGAANVIPPIVLDPVPANLSVSIPAISDGSTAAVPLTLTFTDAGQGTITHSDPLVYGSMVPISLTLTTYGTANGTYSASATCSPTASTFNNITPATQIYYCPNGAMTLGTVEGAVLSNGVQAGFVTQRAAYPPTTQSLWESSPPNGLATVNSLYANDTDSKFVLGACCSSFSFAFVANALYSQSTYWQEAAYASFDLYPAFLTPGGAYFITDWVGIHNGPAVYPWQMFGNEYGNSVGNIAQFTPTDQTQNPNQVYAAETDESAVGNIQQFSYPGGIPAIVSTVSMLPRFPDSIALGPYPRLYVGFSNSNLVGALDITQGGGVLNGGGAAYLTLDNAYNSTLTSANRGIAYGVAYGASQAIEIFTVNGGAQKLYTFASTTDQLPATILASGTVPTMAYDLATGNDGRLYLVVQNALGNSRVVAYDTKLNTLTDPAIDVSLFDAHRPMRISPGKNGTILVAGTIGNDTDVAVIQYP